MFGRSTRLYTAATAMLLAAGLSAGCGRSGGAQGAQRTPTSAAPSRAAADAGDFGTLKQVCGPGSASGATSRGVTSTSIRVGTSADPGAAATPGLEQEFFDTADAFTKWCNAAGGINGRKLVLDKWDAKLFNSAAIVINACQTDFMLVGNGNVIDSPMQKPRLACNLGQIPAYVTSPEAVTAGQQVQSNPTSETEYPIGGIRLLANAYPDSKSGIGIDSSTIASVRPQGLRAQEASKKLGYTVSSLIEHRLSIDNYRPFMEQFRMTGTKGYNEIVAQNPEPEVQAMQNVGFKPDWVLWGTQFYDNKSVQAAKATAFPPSYVYLQHLPFELSDQYPVLRQVKAMLKAAVSKPQYTSFTALSFNSWVLWAESVKACGSNVTEDCVLQKAGAQSAWTAGGLVPPRNLDPAHPDPTDCFAMVRLTPNGFVYDRKVTNPNQGVYNCDKQNVITVKSYG